jgi:hypothetical protein
MDMSSRRTTSLISVVPSDMPNCFIVSLSHLWDISQIKATSTSGNFLYAAM